MANQQDFTTFRSNIEPSQSTIDYISSVQNNLREYLKYHHDYCDIYKDTFLSGSYAKYTSIRPVKGDKKRDVDIIVVTNHTKADDSKKVIQELYDDLIESSIYQNAVIQHHSIGIELKQISIDVVPVTIDQDDPDLYWVADSYTGRWAKTDPKGHKKWSTNVNQSNRNMYKPLVKILKWWRRVNCPDGTKYPKGITLEKIIADNIGDTSGTIEDLLISTMQNIVEAYKEDYICSWKMPRIEDPSDKIQDNDLLSGYSFSDFKAFVLKLDEHITLLNDEGTECDTWRKILGTEVPNSSRTHGSLSNISLCAFAPHRQKPIWPFARGGAVAVTLSAEDADGNTISYENNGVPLKKNVKLHFKALTGVKEPYFVKWQITNTGDEARNAGDLRGEFIDSNEGRNGRRETTRYTGTHSVQCFVIKGNSCVAKSKDFIINIV